MGRFSARPGREQVKDKNISSSQSFPRRRSLPRLHRPAYPPYEYKALPGPRSIRLLRCVHYDVETRQIFALLEPFSIDNCPKYQALSYTWGPALEQSEKDAKQEELIKPCVLLLIDPPDFHHLGPAEAEQCGPGSTVGWAAGCIRSIAIGRNLSDFLLQLNDERCRGNHFPPSTVSLWIDAVCINQKDKAEQASQILLMGDIYSIAENVIVWLGRDETDLDTFSWMIFTVFLKLLDLKPPGVSSSSELANWLRAYDSMSPDFWLPIVGLKPIKADWLSTWLSFYRFIQQRRWFSRAWTMQEFCLAQRVTMICGRSVLPGDGAITFVDFLRLCGWTGDLRLLPVRSEVPLDMGNIGQLRYLCRVRSLNEFTTGRATDRENAFEKVILFLKWLLDTCRMRDCSIAVDKVYAVLGIASVFVPAGQVCPFKVDPTATAAQVYIGICKLILENTNSLDILSMVEDKRYRRVLDLPSWVPDFSTTSTSTQLANLPGFDATLVQQHGQKAPLVDGGTLIVQGASIATISATYDCMNWHELTLSTLKLALTLDAVYSATGHGRLQAVLRTLVLDNAAPISQGHEVVWEDSAAFYGFMTVGIRQLLELNRADDALEALVALQTLDANCPSSLDKAIASLKHHSDEMPMSDINAALDDLAVYRVGADTYFRLLREHIANRTLFLASNGYIGLGRQPGQPGDTVWLLEHGTVPYMLRKCTGEDTYTFIGDCYLHGGMRGELMTPELGKQFSQIRII
jgi:hypothetical protein